MKKNSRGGCVFDSLYRGRPKRDQRTTTDAGVIAQQSAMATIAARFTVVGSTSSSVPAWVIEEGVFVTRA